MIWNQRWEEIFKKRDWGKYPPEELIRFVAKYYYSVNNRSKIRILDLGCGTGSCVWYLAREGFSVFGIDGSPTAINKARQRLDKEKLTAGLLVGSVDFIPWKDAIFDCVIDIGCLTCNSEDDTKIILKEVHRVLKKGGRHFSLTPKGGFWAYSSGIKVDDTSYINIKNGPFANMGLVRFATRKSLQSFYSKFKNLEIEYLSRTISNGNKVISHWFLNCKK